MGKTRTGYSAAGLVFAATISASSAWAQDMRSSQVLGAYIQGRDIDLFGTQQQLYERFRDKYSNQIE